ncbi:MAG: BrnT family toxin [Spirochaetaceae bacterium]|jgi:uncharacterized DUF497 family protein|nr:BrnT family toxin [Spirochaetaceae bacterium]
MFFEWDEDKNSINKIKHKISFQEATYVFADPYAVTRNDDTENEHREQIIGQIGGTLLALVVFTTRNKQGADVIRLISARKATSAERRKYASGKWF